MMSSHRSIGLGVVGSGRMGTHRARLAAAHPGVEYLRVMDISLEAAERLAKTTEADAYGDDLAALIDDPRVDAVIVSLPEDTHVDAVVAACASGRPVMVEKPLALEIAGGSKMVAEAAAADVDLRVAYSARFLQKYFVGRDHVHRGAIGQVVGGWARVYSTRAQGLAILRRSVHATPVMDVLTYLVDLVGWYVGEDVVPVEALARGHGVVFRDNGFDVDDVTSATLTYSDGSVFGFDVCYMLPMGFPTTGQSIRFEMFGSEGALLIDDDHREQMLYTEQGHQNAYAGDQEVNLYFLGSQSAGEWADGRMFGRVAEETRTWLDYLTAGTPCHLSTGKEALVTLAATLAIEEASRTGEAVAVERP